MRSGNTNNGYQFNTFSGVFLPSILTILGVVMFMRLGTIVGELGVVWALVILFFAESIAAATGLSISAISTNTPVKSGGPYFLISRALGPGFGASIGLTYFVSQSLSVPFYIIGFGEALITFFPELAIFQWWISIIPLVVLFAVAMIGANWAIRTQYVIMGVLALSIIVIFVSAIACGPNLKQLAANADVISGKSINILVLATAFAIFFPAVTGFLAGVNMSGDLKDARKSIPLGTICAIIVGFVIYLFEILLLGATWDRNLLWNNAYGTLINNAIFHSGILIFAGMAAATLSSALGTLIGAPRILQAFAADKIIPGFAIFAKGRGKNNDPAVAMILTLVISVSVIYWSSQNSGNALNAVAELVTMFTLCTYAIINIAAAVEDFAANPSYRPKFRSFHWLIGCYGAIACFAAALFINALLFLVAFFVIALFFLLVRIWSLEVTFGDARRGYYFAHIRRYLLRLSSTPADTKNWRPQILILYGSEKKHLALIRYGSLLNNARGILSVARIMTVSPEGSALIRERHHAFEDLQSISKEIGIDFFPQVVAVYTDQEFDQALNIFIQSHSFGPLAPNIVFTGWPVNASRVQAFFTHLSIIRQLRMNSLVLVNSERANFAPNGSIDIWWRGRKNGSLMLILAHLLSSNRVWHKIPIRLIRMATPEQRNEAEQELLQLSVDSRIDAQRLVISDECDFTTVFRSNSANAAVVFLGFIPPKTEECCSFYDKINQLLKDMPTTFLVASAGDTDVDS